MMNGYGYGDHGMGAGDWIGMGVGLVVLTALVVLVIVLLTRARTTPAMTPVKAAPGRESAEELLQRRLAEGAIAPDEYRARLAALRAEEPPPP